VHLQELGLEGQGVLSFGFMIDRSSLAPFVVGV
jgi:hypothetical protein